MFLEVFLSEVQGSSEVDSSESDVPGSLEHDGHFLLAFRLVFFVFLLVDLVQEFRP